MRLLEAKDIKIGDIRMMIKRKGALLAAVTLIIGTASFQYAPMSKAAAQKPKLNIKKLDMTLGNNFQLRVYNMKKKFKASYVSANPNLLSVSSVSSNTKTAVLRAQGIGSSNVTITIQRPKKKPLTLTCRVKVSPEAFTIKFVKHKLNMEIGSSFQANTIIKPASSTEQPIFESSNPEIATVSPSGLVTGVSKGRAKITATLLSTNQTATCTVNVTAPGKSYNSSKQRMSTDGNSTL
jgi:hypothetical protein